MITIYKNGQSRKVKKKVWKLWPSHKYGFEILKEGESVPNVKTPVEIANLSQKKNVVVENKLPEIPVENKSEVESDPLSDIDKETESTEKINALKDRKRGPKSKTK